MGSDSDKDADSDTDTNADTAADTDTDTDTATDTDGAVSLQTQSDRFAAACGLGGTQAPRVFVNGLEFDLSAHKKLLRLAIAAHDQLIMTLQRAAYYGEVTDADNILDYLMSKDGVVTRLPHASIVEPHRFVSIHSRVAHPMPLGTNWWWGI